MDKRLHYLDHLKVALTCLVVAHHAGQPYGGSNGFWYVESVEQTNLGAFFSVNAGFFMSLFFFISAYFMPGSFERKGATRFLADRLNKLGIPLLAGFLALIPVIMYAYYLNFRPYESLSFFDYYASVYFGLGGMPSDWSGPSWPDMQFAHLWFIEHLLVYAILYAAVRYAARSWLPERKLATEPDATYPPLSNASILAFAIVVASITYAVRTVSPIDVWTGFLGIIQTEFAHVPQYAAFFMAGIYAYRRRWLLTMIPRVGLAWLAIGLTLAAGRYGGWIDVTPGGTGRVAIIYACVETFLAIGLSIGLLYLFRRYANRPSRLLARMSAAAFTVYVIHVPVLVLLQYMLRHAEIAPMGKFVAAAAVGIVLSFAIGGMLTALLRQVRIRR
jgi:glucans biosynthesis protein C